MTNDSSRMEAFSFCSAFSFFISLPLSIRTPSCILEGRNRQYKAHHFDVSSVLNNGRKVRSCCLCSILRASGGGWSRSFARSARSFGVLNNKNMYSTTDSGRTTVKKQKKAGAPKRFLRFSFASRWSMMLAFTFHARFHPNKNRPFDHPGQTNSFSPFKTHPISHRQ